MKPHSCRALVGVCVCCRTVKVEKATFCRDCKRERYLEQQRRWQTANVRALPSLPALVRERAS